MRRRWYTNALTWIALFGHLMWPTIFLAVMWLGPSGRTIVLGGREIWVPHCETCEKAKDSVQTAADMGHLDLVAVSLTVLGVVLAVVAVCGFFMVRTAAIQAARDEARERIEHRLPEMIGPEIVAQALRQNQWLVHNAVIQARGSEQGCSVFVMSRRSP